MNTLLIANFLAGSALINAFLLFYAIPKIRRESNYWKQRSTAYEKYLDEVFAGREDIDLADVKQPPPDIVA